MTARVEGTPWELPVGRSAPGGPGGPGGPGAVGEVLVARYHRFAAAVFDAAGEAEVRLGNPPLGSWWLVERLFVETTNALATEATIFVGSPNVDNRRDFTSAGNGDVAEFPRGLYVAGGADLIIQWTAGAVGQIAQAGAQLAELTG